MCLLRKQLFPAPITWNAGGLCLLVPSPTILRLILLLASLLARKGKVRQRTGWPEVSVPRKEKWWRARHTEFRVQILPQCPGVTMDHKASPCWASAFSPMKWAHLTCKSAYNTCVQNCKRQYGDPCEGQSLAPRMGPFPLASHQGTANPQGMFVRMGESSCES